MERVEWRRRYKNRLVERGLSPEEAEDILQPVGDDYDCDPEMAADDELSYWASDG